MKMRMVAKIAKIGAKKRSTHLNENILDKEFIDQGFDEIFSLTVFWQKFRERSYTKESW